MKFVSVILMILCLLISATSPVHAEEKPLADKTLISWVAPANLTQRGGSVLTLDDAQLHFDGIVFGELSPAKWMAGSNLFQRTKQQQQSWPTETADAKTLVQIAIVYQGRAITVLRNGQPYSQHSIESPQLFRDGNVLLIGPRHVGNRDCFAGEIADARIYDRALSAAEIASLKPGQTGDLKPWAWFSFDQGAAKERTGRFPGVKLTGKTKIANGRLILAGDGGLYAAATDRLANDAAQATFGVPVAAATPSEEMVLNYHLMHPGGASVPGDPNAAFAIEGKYHLHYILAHPWKGRTSFSFVHVTSTDMLHWKWETTKLQPSFTGHGMFSGTGFYTTSGEPAVIYHGESSGRNQIAIAKDKSLSAWEKPFPVEVLNRDGSPAQMRHWDPDCFRIGETYYAISGGENPPVFKSTDLKKWTLVGDFLKHDLPDVAKGEDVSCGNFFKLGNKWMMLCISHPLGCRYYLGDWDETREQFVPQQHGRMNWRREIQSLYGPPHWRVDFFAPESLETPGGRRVMWAWLAAVGMNNGAMNTQTIQSLPRELSLPADGVLRIKPLRELESLREEPKTIENFEVHELSPEVIPVGAPSGMVVCQLGSDACEIRATISRDQAERKLFGFTLFSDGKGGGLPVLFRPENGTLRVGTAEAPFSVAALPAGEDVELRIFVDKYLVEVFVNDRQALVGWHGESAGKRELRAFSIGTPTVIKNLTHWNLKPTNAGFREAQKSRIWEPKTE